jgi:hypothetical protein
VPTFCFCSVSHFGRNVSSCCLGTTKFSCRIFSFSSSSEWGLFTHTLTFSVPHEWKSWIWIGQASRPQSLKYHSFTKNFSQPIHSVISCEGRSIKYPYVFFVFIQLLIKGIQNWSCIAFGIYFAKRTVPLFSEHWLRTTLRLTSHVQAECSKNDCASVLESDRIMVSFRKEAAGLPTSEWKAAGLIINWSSCISSPGNWLEKDCFGILDYFLSGMADQKMAGEHFDFCTHLRLVPQTEDLIDDKYWKVVSSKNRQQSPFAHNIL